jgi:N utilization substance protein A
VVRLVDPEGQHAHVLVPPDQLSLAIGREGQNVRLAARLTGWKIDIKNSTEYDQTSEDAVVAELISQREEEEALQREAEERIAVEQAARAEEDARLRELYPLPEDEEGYTEDGQYYEDAEVAVEEPVAEVDEETVETTETELQAGEQVEAQSEQQNDAPDPEVAPSTSDDEEGAR